jgi:AcrR family transcriptional regulator
MAGALPSRRDERKARSREAILSTARELIAVGGLTATSTQKVALAAGLSHGALFLHFPRREDLLSAVATAFAADFEASLGPAGPSLEAELTLQLERLAAAETLYTRLLAEETALPAPAREALRALERALVARVAAAFAADRPQLGLRQLSPRLVAAAWLALVQRALLRGETGAALPEWGGEIRRFILELVAA